MITHLDIKGQELGLIARAQAGDQSAAATLLEAHDRFMRSYARKYARVEGIDFDDVLQEIRLGFMKAVRRFKVRSGYKLLTYAKWWMRHYANRFVQNSIGDIRTPVFRHGRDYAGPIRARRLDAPLRDADGDVDGTMLDQIADGAPDLDEQIDEKRRADRMREVYIEALRGLDERERVIAIDRIATHDLDQRTLHEIGDRFGICRERVRQIQRKTEAKLRTRLQAVGARELVA